MRLVVALNDLGVTDILMYACFVKRNSNIDVSWKAETVELQLAGRFPGTSVSRSHCNIGYCLHKI